MGSQKISTDLSIKYIFIQLRFCVITTGKLKNFCSSNLIFLEHCEVELYNVLVTRLPVRLTYFSYLRKEPEQTRKVSFLKSH